MTKEQKERARQRVTDTALYLYDRGLLLRHFGNISCRIDDDSFFITPGGVKFSELTPESVVEVKTADLGYEGNIEPPAESRLHAAIYQTRHDARFVVHTHQVYASCAGVLGRRRVRTELDEERIILPIAAYAPSGTGKLADNVRSAVKRFPDSRAILMANHGAICYGSNEDDAVIETERLEKACEAFLINICRLDMSHGIKEGYSSRLDNGMILFSRKDTPERIKRLHTQVYRKRKDVRVILHNMSEAVLLVSRRGERLLPLFDDFAQFIGEDVYIPSNHGGYDGERVDIKRNVNAVFIRNEGALCLGKDVEDASVAALLLDKECLADTAVMHFGEGQYLTRQDTRNIRRRKNAY